MLRESGVTLLDARVVILELCGDERSSDTYEQESHANILAVQNYLWNALQLLDILINRLDREVFDAVFLESDWDLDRQRVRAMSPDFQPPIKTYRDDMMAKRNSLAHMLGMNERLPHDLSPRDYQRREVEWMFELPVRVRM